MRPALAALVLLTACDRAVPAPEPTPREKMTREFTQAMKQIDLANEQIDKDLKAGKPADEVRARLAKIKESAGRASALPYRPSEAENRDLAFEFRKFLDTVAKLEKATWSGADGAAAHRQLSKACLSCHQIYRPDEDR